LKRFWQTPSFKLISIIAAGDYGCSENEYGKDRSQGHTMRRIRVCWNWTEENPIV